jgi:hypothetical protein
MKIIWPQIFSYETKIHGSKDEISSQKIIDYRVVEGEFLRSRQSDPEPRDYLSYLTPKFIMQLHGLRHWIVS